MRYWAFVVIAIFLVCSSTASAVNSSPQDKVVSGVCLGQEKVICSDYIKRSSSGSLAFFYRYGRSTKAKSVQKALTRLKKQYYNFPLRKVLKRVAPWPHGLARVKTLNIVITKVWYNLIAGFAELTTKETWVVQSGKGKVLYSENERIHKITMYHTKNRWVVISGL